uniref:Putative ribose-5-phosphate isomerase n=1 Tax=Aegilops tauschii TaxID=37682 RepID=M8C3S0_AEGTA
MGSAASPPRALDAAAQEDLKRGSARRAVDMVVPSGSAYTLGLIRKVFDKLPGFHARLRTVKSKASDRQEELFLTDNGNHIVEMFFEDGIHGNLRDISDSLLRITGVVEHGMFLGMATKVIVAKKDGTVAVLSKK